MASSIFFPYFYLSNDTLLRHQYLYAPSVVRVHPCDRPPRDNKDVKRFLSELMQVGFLENASQDEFDETINARFLQTIERGFQQNRPLYLKQLGKYEKERTSAKTFHLCRKKDWGELVQRLMDWGIASLDNYDEWCFSTRMMVMTLTSCVTLVRQRERMLPRCTDQLEYDELASLIECFPADDGSDAVLRRGILEFPYFVPQNLSSMLLDRLMTLRDDFAAITGDFQQSLIDDAKDLNQTASNAELEERIKCVGERIQEIVKRLGDTLKSRNESVKEVYAQYRWYIPPGSPLAELSFETPSVHQDLAFTTLDAPAAQTEIERTTSYPGCFIWTLENPAIIRKSGGFLKRLFSFGKG